MNHSNDIAVCFLCGKIMQDHLSEVIQKSKVGIQNPSEAFQNAIIEGLSQNLKRLDILSLPFIGSYPINYKSILSPPNIVKHINTSRGHSICWKNIRFNNLIYFKYHFRYWAAYKALKQYCKANSQKEKIIIIIYGVQINLITAALKLKKRFKNLKICVVVPDLPEHKVCSKSGWGKWLYNYDTHVPKGLYEAIDGFVLLTQEMHDKVCLSNQPWVLVEGIYNPNTDDENTPSDIMQTLQLNQYKTILYTGSLSHIYNINGLVDAFMKIKDSNARLLVCGRGSSSHYIESMAKKDPRIIYLGSIPRSEVLKLQREVDILVNPRKPDGEFTKYSFPSKTMEYLASGTPTILYKLSGIPPEYYNYCFALNETSINKLTEALNNILQNDNGYLVEYGQRARNYILSNKNPYIQCKKIVDFINRL